MERFFLKIYSFFAAHKRRLLAFVLPIALCVFFIYEAKRITPYEDISAFLPYKKNDNPAQSLYKNLRSQDKIVIVFSSKNASAEGADYLTEAADDFTLRYGEKKPQGAKDEALKIDASVFLTAAQNAVENMPLLLEDADYKRIDSILNKGEFQKIFRDNREQLESYMGPFVQEAILGDPLHFSAPILTKLSAMGSGTGYKVIGDYLFTQDSTRLIMTLGSEYGGSETKNNARLIQALDEIKDSTIAHYNNLNISLLGAPAVAVSNAGRIATDSLWCAVGALLLILALLGWYFRNLRSIALICLPVLFGVLLGLAYIGLFSQHVSSIALSACCVIFGIGVDYALLYSIRIGYTGSAKEALRDIVKPMVIGNITTVGAFFSLLALTSKGMRDFGLFAAISLVGAILFVVIFLPHWVGEKSYKARDGGWLGKWANMQPEKWRALPYILITLTVILFFFSRKVEFSGDFNKINYVTNEQQELMDEMDIYASKENKTALYAVAKGADLDEALEQNEKLQLFINENVRDGIITRAKGIGGFMLSKAKQRGRIEKWNEWQAIHKEQIYSVLDEYGEGEGFTEDAFDSFKQLLGSNLQPEEADVKFAPLLNSALKEYVTINEDGNALIMNILYLSKENLEQIYERFEAGGFKDGAFLFDSVSMTRRMLANLKQDFNKVLGICSLLVFIFLWIAFGRIEMALIAFLPMALSWIWICGIMAIARVDFNIVNVILATFIFGLGDDYTVFIVEGLEYEYNTGKKMLASYKVGVTLSALTMFIGLGALAFAKHPALSSLGIVAVIGMLCVVAMAYVVPPMLFKWLTTMQIKGQTVLRRSPIRLADIAVTILGVIVFALASLCYRVRLLIAPKISKARLHRELYNIMYRFVKWFPRVGLIIEEPSGLIVNKIDKSYRKRLKEFIDGEKPSVIICNHQSQLDIMYLLALSDKIVLLTNKRVYKQPAYSYIMKKAGFICVEDTINENFTQIKEAVEEGYSVVIFPEGTRSEDGSIGSFHSGAFYLQKKLGLDILPLMLRGVGDIMPKHEAFLRSGNVTIKIMERIKVEALQNGAWGDRALKRAKAFERFYKERLQLKD